MQITIDSDLLTGKEIATLLERIITEVKYMDSVSGYHGDIYNNGELAGEWIG